jgi:hypothetical protein
MRQHDQEYLDEKLEALRELLKDLDDRREILIAKIAKAEKRARAAGVGSRPQRQGTGEGGVSPLADTGLTGS